MAQTTHETVFDTTQQHLGAVYARALLGATENTGSTDVVMSELESLVGDVLGKVPNLEQILSSPRLSVEDKEGILDRALGSQLSKELLVFLKVVARRGRFDCLRPIARAARQQYNRLRGRVQVQVRSAAALDSDSQKLVANQLQAALGHEVDLQLDVDATLIGGLVIRVGDTVYDGSIANRLSRLGDAVVWSATQKIRGDLDRFIVTESADSGGSTGSAESTE